MKPKSATADRTRTETDSLYREMVGALGALSRSARLSPLRAKKLFPPFLLQIVVMLFAESRDLLPLSSRGRSLLQKLRQPVTRKPSAVDLYRDFLRVLRSLTRKNAGFFPAGERLFHADSLQGLESLALANADFQTALRSLFSRDFLSLPIESLGRVYEQFHVHLPGVALLDQRRSGSFYTPRVLVDLLVESALAPTVQETLQRVGREERAAALLKLRVVDPACGGAAFLLAAHDYLGKVLSRLQSGGRQKALTDLLRGSLYGVDRNPQAAELTRISLWLNARAKDLAPGQLHGTVKQGDSLLGIPLNENFPSRRAADHWFEDFFRPLGKGLKELPSFHWQWEFPAVFQGSRPGFDCVLGNPPWERIKIQEKEFFLERAPAIARAGKADQRARCIEALEKNRPALFRRFRESLLLSTRVSRFFRESGRYPLAAGKDLNLYLLFALLFRDLLAPQGRAGLVVPSGLATDLGSSPVFRDFVDRGNLVSLVDFLNRERIFPGIAGPNRFSLVTLAGSGRSVQRPIFQFYAGKPEDLRDEKRRFTLSRAEFSLLNPNTLTCPPLAGRDQARLLKRIYRRWPVFIRETAGQEDANPWGVRFWNMFHMSSHAALFQVRDELLGQGFRMNRQGGFQREKEHYLRLYEAKLMHNLNHRYNTFEGVRPEKRVGVKPGALAVTVDQAGDPTFCVEPRYWVPEKAVLEAAQRAGWDRKWFLALRSVTNVTTNRRSAMAAILPWCGVGNSATLIRVDGPIENAALLAGCCSSLAFDYVTRMKLGGPNLNFFILKQLPLPPPAVFERPFAGGRLKDWLIPRVVELVHNARDLTPFARDLGFKGSPLPWDEPRRALLQAELDAVFLLLYGIARRELGALFEAFPILARKEQDGFGEFRTRRLTLAAYERLAPALISG